MEDILPVYESMLASEKRLRHELSFEVKLSWRSAFWFNLCDKSEIEALFSTSWKN